MSPRSLAERQRDVHIRLRDDIDAWVATADPATGNPNLSPLSFLWSDGVLVFATAETSPTGRNLATTGVVRLGIGLVRDVVLIEGTVVAIPLSELATHLSEAFAAKAGFDPRPLDGFSFFVVTPVRIQAWRDVDELDGRVVMRGGAWLEA
jgi:Pyridoxamine 5'-phosphate oxidase